MMAWMSPPLRATFSPAHPLARRAVPVARVRAFQSSISLCLSLGEWPRLPVTARIERPLFHRGGSASKKGTWPLPAILLRPRVARAQGTHRAITPLLADFFSILLEQIADQLHRLFGRGSGMDEMWREIFEQAHPGLVGPQQNHGLLGLQCQCNF